MPLLSEESLKRNVRVGGIALIDLFITILFSLLLTSLKYDFIINGSLNPEYFVKFSMIFVCVVILGIAVHWITDTKTGLNYKLGLSEKPN